MEQAGLEQEQIWGAGFTSRGLTYYATMPASSLVHFKTVVSFPVTGRLDPYMEIMRHREGRSVVLTGVDLYFILNLTIILK